MSYIEKKKKLRAVSVFLGVNNRRCDCVLILLNMIETILLYLWIMYAFRSGLLAIRDLFFKFLNFYGLIVMFRIYCRATVNVSGCDSKGISSN